MMDDECSMVSYVYAYPDDLLPTKGSRCKRKQVTVTVDSEHPKQATWHPAKLY